MMSAASLGQHLGRPLQMPAAAQRVVFVDHLRAIGIVMVVYGHVAATSDLLRTLIYSMHMPLFFFASGYLLSNARAALPVVAALRRGVRTLLVPYLFFFLVSLGYWLATRDIGPRAAKFQGVGVADALHGLASGLSSDLFVNVTLWFLPCLFCCQVIFALARRRLPAGLLALLLVLAALLVLATTLPWHERLPWGLDIVWIALPFYALGHALRVSAPIERPGGAVTDGAPRLISASGVLAGPGGGALALLLSAAIWLPLVQVQGGVDLAAAHFGPYPLLYLPCAAAGLAFFVVVSVMLARLLPPNAALTLLSRHSLAIFALHPLLINFASGAAKLGGFAALTEAQPLAWSLLVTAFGLLGGLAAGLLLERHAPRLLGRGGAAGGAS